MFLIKSAYFRLFLILLLLVIISDDVQAQFYFGKNKVQYTEFDWQVMETEHFRIYFYTDEKEITQIAARYAEDSYLFLAAKFKHEIKGKTPLIIYSSPNYFTQTNVISMLLPESVGGFTEFMKGRVVVPFHGSFHDFNHVIRHELVHVFQLSKLESVMSYEQSRRTAMPPLWFIEGQAEYWSTGWNTEADMIVKDMVLSGNIYTIDKLPAISGTYLMYKLGQSICQFINDYYGSDKLVLIYENWWKARDFDRIIALTLGEPLSEVSRKWVYHLKKKYFPQVADRGFIKGETRQLTRQGYALKGVPVNFGEGEYTREWIVYKANKMGYSGIYMMSPAGDKKKVHTVVKGERSASFESLHLFQSGIDANDDGLIVFSSKSEESDVLYIYDLNQHKAINKYKFPELATITSPRFAPDGKMVVFSGAKKSGIVNIFILSLISGELTQITDDIYYNIDPTFNINGDSIIFASDKCPGGESGAINLYRISIDGGISLPLTSGWWRDRSPEVTPAGIYFSSDRDGSSNIFRLNNDGTANQITSLLTGAYDPRTTSSGNSMIFSGYQDFMFSIFQTNIHDTMVIATEEKPHGQLFWKPRKLASKSSGSSVKYNTDYSFDIAQSAISIDPVYGSMGGLQVALSDMLGDNVYYFLLSNTAETKDELLTSFNIAVTYLNKKHRLNWGLGIFHLYNEYYNDYEGYFKERQAGGMVFLNYPLSRFYRLETTTYLRYSDKDITFFKRRRAFLMSNYLSFVSDNSLWDISGPIEGRRYNFTLGITTALDEGKQYNRLALADIRHYLRLGKYSAFASRIFIYNSTGFEPQRLYFGGSWSFRGYDRRHFYHRNIIFASNELRFPLVDHLIVGFPFGGIGFSAIRGAVFFDVGSLRDDGFYFLDDKFFDDLQGSFGAGFRVAFARMILLRFDFTRTTDFESISPRTDFDFFFGWNF